MGARLRSLGRAMFGLGFGLAVVMLALGYHGPRLFAGVAASDAASSLPALAEVVAHARSLAGVPYDPLMGTHGNIGADAGFIVCSDVPNIAYGLAGYSLQTVLERDFVRHPAAYRSDHGNVPGNPYFHRRARNLFAYFRVNGRVLAPDALPRAGDLAFYHQTELGEVSHVALVTAVDGAHYRVMESAPETVLAGEVAGEAPGRRGWRLVGFGRME